MEETKTPEPKKGSNVMAGQPITFGGVAGFGFSSWRRLFIAQAVVAAGAVAAVLILLLNAWLPAIDHSIQNLPENGYILHGQLAWPDEHTVKLSDSRWLTVVVTPMNSHTFGRSADVQLELHSKEARIYSMLGYVQFPYDPDFSLMLSRTDAEPWWGARRPFFVGGVIVGTFVGLWFQWMLLAVLYAPVAKFLAFWGDRDLQWSQTIRLCAAALLTPAVLYCIAIALYGLGGLPLGTLLVACGLHVILGWAYEAGAVMRIKSRTELATIPKQNPFDQPKKPDSGSDPAAKPASNPFKGY
jgi:hypothetical protein